MDRFGVHVLWTARYDYEKGSQLHTHEHAFYQVIWIADGKGEFICNNEQYSMEAGTLFFIKPGCSHGFRAAASSPAKTLDIKFNIVSSLIKEEVANLPVRFSGVSGDIVSLLENIRQEGAIQHLFYKELASIHLVEMTYRLARAANSNKSPSADKVFTSGPFVLPSEGSYEAAHKVEQWILAHYDKDWTVEDLSKELGYSSSHLRQLFKKNKGSTIAAFHKEVRIRQSKEWMTYSDCTLQQVAERVGFKTIHHFSRVFKQYEGITAGQWLAREKRGICKDILFEDL